MQAPRAIRQLIARQVLGRRSYHAGDHSVSTLNDLPIPQGSWKTHYDAKQRSYNAHLLIGISALVGTLIFGRAVGFLDSHNDIPERPADIASYK